MAAGSEPGNAFSDYGGLTRRQQDNLIMEYLIAEGYGEAARELASEAGLPVPGIELRMEERREGIDAIHRGDAEKALQCSQSIGVFPTSGPSTLKFELLLLRLQSMIDNANTKNDNAAGLAAINLVTSELTPLLDSVQESTSRNELKEALEDVLAGLILPEPLDSRPSSEELSRARGENLARIADMFGKEARRALNMPDDDCVLLKACLIQAAVIARKEANGLVRNI